MLLSSCGFFCFICPSLTIDNFIALQWPILIYPDIHSTYQPPSRNTPFLEQAASEIRTKLCKLCFMQL